MKAPFRYLVYREAVMSLKYMKNAMVSFVGTAAVFLLVRLSLEYGNLALLFSDDSEATAIASPMFIGLDFLPVAMLGTMLMCFAEANQHETVAAWRRFRMSLPVSPWKYALAKFVFIAIILVIAIAVGIGYMALSCSLSGTAFDEKMIGLILIVFALMLAFAMLMKILVYVFGSMEKAGVASVMIILYVVMPVMFGNEEIEAQKMFSLYDKVGEYIPLIVLAVVGILALGYVATALLLKRRER